VASVDWRAPAAALAAITAKVSLAESNGDHHLRSHAWERARGLVDLLRDARSSSLDALTVAPGHHREEGEHGRHQRGADH
jgi:hypothetical protein